MSPPPGDDGIFTERVWGGWSEARGWTGAPAPASRTHVQELHVFLTCDVFGGAYDRPNIFLADFLSAAFTKLCIRFILSWMKRSFQC